jgi:glycosyltransferase involved in cell wall biosynthesis
MAKKYVFLTNIPTPYRTSFYNALARQGFDFEVYYMRETEADRNWSVDRSLMRHRHYIDRGLYRMIGHYHLHINPRLLWKILRNPRTEIIIGGGWNDIDVLMLVVLKRLGVLRNRLHFWSEANYLTIGARRDNRVKRAVRKFVYHSSNGAQLRSGKMVEITLERWGIRNPRFVPLPNTIEEERFQLSPSAEAQRARNPRPVFLMPVRLQEKIKGIMNFFQSIGDDNVRRCRFLVAGDGPDRPAIEQFIRERGLQEHIELLGFCNTERMVSLYGEANALVLPSYSDPNPLVLIEGLKMQLPLLVSDHCGNHYEVVAEGRNGYVFDPADPQSVKRAFEALMSDNARWPEMGLVSAELYRTEYAREPVIRNFIESIEALP